jgi:type II secretory pathway pseudopilin PulG
MVEMLTVIAIISILAGVLLPVLSTARNRANVAKAQAAVSSLTTAFTAYYTEYGRWPVTDGTPNVTYIVDTNMVILLQGTDVPTGTPAVTPTGTLGTLGGNPRRIVFMNFNAKDLNSAGAFVDPWQGIYRCRFDTQYANQIQDPFVASIKLITAGALLWSDGPDKKPANGVADDINGDKSAANADNIISW